MAVVSMLRGAANPYLGRIEAAANAAAAPAAVFRKSLRSIDLSQIAIINLLLLCDIQQTGLRGLSAESKLVFEDMLHQHQTS